VRHSKGRSVKDLRRVFHNQGQRHGIGLATVHALVKQLGGHISVDSTENVGTTFTSIFRLLPNRCRQSSPATMGRASSRLRVVLLVEDDPRVRQLIELILRKAGHDIVVVENAAEALIVLTTRTTSTSC